MAIPNLSYFSEARVAAGKIMEVILRAPKIETDSNEGETFENVMGNVEFKLVKFAYPSRPESLILNNFNLKVSAGKSLALVGSSGAGKSTIISLLERFYDPVAGEIFLDGVDIRMLNLKWLRSQIGLVSQEPALFATSIKENILLAKANATMEEIFEAAKVANAHDFITQLPHQYDTQVGEGGIQISGGQKQRIAIARAVLMSPKILLLDEATSALDTESERVVQAALNQVSVDRTTVIIAHRLSTIRDANTIAVMHSGQITEIDSHDELINKDNGIYASLIHHQQDNARKATSNPAHSSLQLDQKNFSYSQQKHNALFGFAGYSDGMQVRQPERPSVPSFSRLLMLNKPEWRSAMMGSIGAIFVGACQPIYGYILGFMISVYFLNDHSEIKSKLRIFSFMFLALFVIYFVMSGLQHYNFGAMGERLTKRLREEMLAKILSFEVAWFDKEDNSTGAICSLLAKDANVARSLVSDRMSLLLQTITTVAISSAIGLFISWRMALVLLAMQPLMISSFYIRYVLMKSLSSKAIKSQAIICKLAAEAISNFRTVAAFSAQDQVISMFKVAQEGPQRENIRQSWFAGAACAASSSVLVGSWAINYWYGGKLMSQMLITAKTFFETSLVLITIARVIADAASMTSDIAKGADSVGMVFAILDRKSCIEPEEAVGHKPKKLAGYIDIQGVHFSYPSRPEVLIFNDFSISIEAGKSTAFIGKSGSGKSTIIALIERFYDPLKGTIMIDGKDIKSYDLRSLRRHIGLVSQEPTLFSGTIRENIVYGTNSATQMEVEYASRAANAHDFISSLKDGYDTFCGDNGTQLSGGQKQRIAIARAILRNPEILLLDEATSALDSQSEKVVQEALERMMVNRTSVVVAHRLGTIKNCDLIVVLDKGVVVEKGTHASLLGKGPIGSYYSLVSLQHGNESQMHAAP